MAIPDISFITKVLNPGRLVPRSFGGTPEASRGDSMELCPCVLTANTFKTGFCGPLGVYALYFLIGLLKTTCCSKCLLTRVQGQV